MSDDPDTSPVDSSIPRIAIAVSMLAPLWRDALPEAEALARDAAMAAVTDAVLTDMAGVNGEMELSLALADDAMLRRLNKDYRNQDKPTNVLSFAAGEWDGLGAPGLHASGPLLLGDVVLAIETLRREAIEQDKSLADHLRHLVVHGVLHLLGHDHETEGEAEKMEHLEIRILAGLGIANPYEPLAVEC